MTSTEAALYEKLSAQCARRELCAADVRAKIARAGAPASAEAIVAKLQAEGFIDEARYARAYVADKFRFDGWGPLKIRAALAAKGIDEGVAAEAIAALPSAEVAAARERLLRKLSPGFDELTCYAERQKVLRRLYARGFAPL